MESTPLTLAHAHARNASVETRKANPTAASEEHDLAAGEFANAAKGTTDTEAFRTLKLLEQHHQKLADLLKFRPSDSLHQQNSIAPSPGSPLSSTPKPPSLSSSAGNDVSDLSNPQPPPLPIKLQRESSSSIASNLASARGIPPSRPRRGIQSSVQLSTQHADGKLSSPLRKSRPGEQESRAGQGPEKERTGSKLSSPTRSRGDDSPAADSRSTVQEVSSRPTTTADDPFSRFYATFEGLLSKLSAPLAFAGLPLNPDEPPKPDTIAEKTKVGEQGITEPDVTRLFSKAALRAVREEHGPGGGGLGGAESFYVVPTTGGTISYAGILSRAEREARIAAGEDDDEFVDARETPQPRSPGLTRGSHKPGTKTMEELQLENKALRALSDDLAKRLYRFEVGAQNSSMALAMSMRAFQSPTTSTAAHSPGPSTTGGADKIRELEEQVVAMKKEREKLKRENEKYKSVVERYREKWEKLKDGARERMAVAGTGAGKEDVASGRAT
ncbi:MAG: hypothetical protein Q9187_005634 [Circinaria calcarea]